MLRNLAIGMIVICASAVAADLQAQVSKNSTLGLLQYEQVQKEIKFTAEQKKKLATLNKEVQDAQKALDEKMSKLPEKEFLAKSKEFGKEMEEGEAQAEKKAEDLLKPKQLERFKQIQLQIRLKTPGFALASPQLSKELGLSDDQMAKLKSLNEEMQKSAAEMSPFAGPHSKEEIQRFIKDNEQRNSKAMDILTAEQKEKLEKMKGPAFDVSSLHNKPGGEKRPKIPDGGKGAQKGSPAL